jgi:hypothetical protein
MNKLSFFLAPLLFTLLVLGGCQKDKDLKILTEYVFDFNTGIEGWKVDFVDLPTTDLEIYELDYSHATLPQPLSQNEKGLMIQGHNRSDDLFMYATKQIDGLKPNTRYAVQFNIRLANNAYANSMGIGGSPGSSVYLKAGVTVAEPLKIVGDLGYEAHVLNIDKGNQAEGGKDMQVLGHVGHNGNDIIYQLIDRNNSDQLFEFTSDATGKAWLTVGTDSGFEGLSRIYYRYVKATFIEQ